MAEVYCGLELALEVKVILMETLEKMMMKILVPPENMLVLFSVNLHVVCDILLPLMSYSALIFSLHLVVVLSSLLLART